MAVDQSPMNKLITEHIDIWTSAVKTRSTSGRGSSKKLELYGVKKLRELILELAVRGKLVPQDPSDEPASVLLERIAEEKKRLVKDKLIPRTKGLPPINEDEIPIDLPNGWTVVRLGELTSKLGSGSTPRGGKNAYTSEGIPFLRSQNVRNEGIKLDDIAYISEEIHQKMENTKVLPGDVLLNITGASLGRSTIFPSNLVEANVSQHVTIIRLIESQMNQFIHLGILSPLVQQLVWGRQVGMAIEGLSKKVLEMFEFPIPPIAEQHRIVAKVDELMALCDQLEQQTEASIEAHQVLVTTLLDTLTNSADADELMQNWARISEHFDTLFTTEESIDQLKQTILQLAVMGKLVPQDPSDEPAAELLKRIAEEKAQLVKEKKTKKQKALPPITEDEKPFELPNGWEWERIGTFGVVGTGATPSRSNPKYWDDPKYNWVSSGETSELFVSTTKEKVSELAIQETNVSIYPSGTLIVAMYGQGKTRGQITELTEPAGTNQACAAIQLIEKNESHKDFVKLYFRKSYEELRSNAAGGAQPNLNVGKVQSTVIAVPPLNEQQRINTKVNELLTVCDHLKAHFEAVQNTQLHLTDAIVEQAV
ncbi:TPA: restriction endonuclease subunit S [Vibrio parahaemolyticus]|uniref:restriction endonuclease subunit S n=1 Tax=Vibrio parahaemolyticus TaxID=670 RepID=UPI00112099DA|nr:restriction endonuclease subunit S [Vibrio parahaemolyticus]MCC4217174.1 restriction endonuclease subunit S [Vibrio parahaemolyticus]TOI89327.1 type I restriction endonuclease subunit S [Vibrio parahaemolyticus]HCM0817314.1 restriction endonuclease subunit S [Vibrio parahaemolyticus]HCM0871243.1 restriction endonuclease subunit S [Vibrio parahaemolyticus]